jgi:hypothetical protein
MTKFEEFDAVWRMVTMAGAILFFFISIAIYLVHKIRLGAISSYKGKYDYLRASEIKMYKLVLYSMGVMAALLVNTYPMGITLVMFFIRMGIAIAIGTLIGYVSSLIIEYYYPTQLEKKLRKWRYMPRRNPKTGNVMRLLSEEEEDVHMDEGMKAEEDVFSVDYDVWIDDRSGDVMIEKYPGHLQALRCGTCKFYTLQVKKEEIVTSPTDTEEGELLKHYECSFCKSRRTTSFRIAPLKKDAKSYAHLPLKDVHFKKNYLVQVVKVEVYASTGEKLTYEFQSVEQASKFLAEYDYDTAQKP